MSRFLSYAIVLISPLLFSACRFSASNADLTDYIAETKRRPSGQIEPLPVFKPYETFAYSAMSERSPFEPPVGPPARVSMLPANAKRPPRVRGQRSFRIR